MVFCNEEEYGVYEPVNQVTILILIDGFLQLQCIGLIKPIGLVTILILIDGFLQYGLGNNKERFLKRHNPYFNRWFSAII